MLLLSPNSLIQLRNGIQGGQAGFRPVQWIVSRSECHFFSVSLAGIPAAERESMLKLKIARLSPFSQPGFNVIWQDEHALIWCWDEARRLQLSASIKRRLFSSHATVESRLYSPPTQQTGTRLIRLLEGFEGQYWQQGRLVTSHWWSAPPDRSQWSRFLRGAGLPQDHMPPEVETPVRLKRPWGRERMREQKGNAGLERITWQLLAVVSLLAFGWQAGQFYQYRQANAELEQSLDKQSTRIEHILQARNQAIRDLQHINLLKQALSEPTQLELLDAVIRKLPRPKHHQIVKWDYRPGQLAFVIEGENLDPSSVVRSLESLPWGRGVTAEPNPNQAQMKIIIRLGVSP